MPTGHGRIEATGYERSLPTVHGHIEATGYDRSLPTVHGRIEATVYESSLPTVHGRIVHLQKREVKVLRWFPDGVLKWLVCTYGAKESNGKPSFGIFSLNPC